jgi:hypothetical protein
MTDKKDQPLSEIAAAMVENLAANRADPDFEQDRDEQMARLAIEALQRAGLPPYGASDRVRQLLQRAGARAHDPASPISVEWAYPHPALGAATARLQIALAHGDGAVTDLRLGLTLESADRNATTSIALAFGDLAALERTLADATIVDQIEEALASCAGSLLRQQLERV